MRGLQELSLQINYLPYWRIETWTLLVAMVALVQPWFLAFYKKVLRPGKVEIYETGLPEIGYSAYGSTIGLSGTLRARDRELFIRSAELDVVRISDSSKRQFEWLAFRPLTTVIGRVISELEVELPASFMILPSQPRQYNILFSDPPILEQMQLILKGIRDKWMSELTNSGKFIRLSGKFSDASKQQSLITQLAHETFPDFALTPDYLTALEAIRKLAPWQAGNYQATLKINAAKPTKTHKKSWLLQLTEDDAKNLELNAEKILQGLCTEIVIPHNFANPKYIPNNIITRAELK